MGNELGLAWQRLVVMVKAVKRGVGVGKRGQAAAKATGFILIGLLLAAVVSVSFMKKTFQDVTGVTLEKKYLSRDIALTLDAIYAAPGDVEYGYFMKDYNFFVEIRGSKVFIKESRCEKDEIAGIYPYYDGLEDADKLNGRISPDSDELSKMNIVFAKKGGVVGISVVNGNVEVYKACS